MPPCVDELTGVGARVGQADWLAPRKACDLFFTDVALHDVGARTRRIIAERFPGASLDFVVQQAVDRRKRLVVADLESTLIENEMLDELADFIGVRDKVAEITWRAMNGEIDFVTALKARVALFKDLPEAALGEAAAGIRLMPGACVLRCDVTCAWRLCRARDRGLQCLCPPCPDSARIRRRIRQRTCRRQR